MHKPKTFGKQMTEKPYLNASPPSQTHVEFAELRNEAFPLDGRENERTIVLLHRSIRRNQQGQGSRFCFPALRPSTKAMFSLENMAFVGNLNHRLCRWMVIL